MKKSIKSAIALSLILNLIVISPLKYVSATSNEDGMQMNVFKKMESLEIFQILIL